MFRGKENNNRIWSCRIKIGGFSQKQTDTLQLLNKFMTRFSKSALLFIEGKICKMPSFRLLELTRQILETVCSEIHRNIRTINYVPVLQIPSKWPRPPPSSESIVLDGI